MTEITIEQFEQSIASGKKWIIVKNDIFNIDEFSKIHPGGTKIISAFIGKDATDAWEAMHPDKNMVEKFMTGIKVGILSKDDVAKEEQLMVDFREMREKALREKLFDTDWRFFLLTFAQIPMFEVLAWLTLYYWGVNVASFVVAALLIATSQAQAGWSQHDYGHISVFNTNRLNKITHQIIIGHFKGACSSWWNFRHNLHHSKPNTLHYDPDIGFPDLFLIGKKFPVLWAAAKRGVMPYNKQHKYFMLTLPPLLLPLYFHYENIYFVFKRGKWKDFVFEVSFYLKFFLLFGYFLESWFVIFSFYMLARFFESYWFTLITQMSHIPMESDLNIDLNWVRHQLAATCNVYSSAFNDWFTGHLNFQIEHHLFPDMPRHNYKKVKPYVLALCKQYELNYIDKPLSTAVFDILRSLKTSGELWLEAYTNPG